mgnify:CR=1 FL=1
MLEYLLNIWATNFNRGNSYEIFYSGDTFGSIVYYFLIIATRAYDYLTLWILIKYNFLYWDTVAEMFLDIY